MNNKLRRTGLNVAEVAIILVVLVLANYLGYKFFKRLDVTENKQFTISQATKNVLAGLDDPVSVDFYLSQDLPPQLISVRTRSATSWRSSPPTARQVPRAVHRPATTPGQSWPPARA
jgi:hypothetical protein